MDIPASPTAPLGLAWERPWACGFGIQLELTRMLPRFLIPRRRTWDGRTRKIKAARGINQLLASAELEGEGGSSGGRMLSLRGLAGRRRGCGSSDVPCLPRLLWWLGNLLGAFGKGLGIPHCEHGQRVPLGSSMPLIPVSQPPKSTPCSWDAPGLAHTGEGKPKAIPGLQGRREAARHILPIPSSHPAFQ